MDNAYSCSDYTVLAYKCSQTMTDEIAFDIPIEFFVYRKRSKLVINPIYRIFSKSKKSIHVWRQRQNEKWELECLMMLKAMPLEIEISIIIMNNLRDNILSEEMIPLLNRGIILEVPENYM